MNTGIFENNFSVDLFKIFNLLPESGYLIKEGKQSSFSRFWYIGIRVDSLNVFGKFKKNKYIYYK